MSASLLCGRQAPPARATASSATTLTLPLQQAAGGILTTGVFIDGEPFRLIVDTGSPYMVVPLDNCFTQPPKLSYYGCASPGQFRASGQPSTIEQYGALPGRMDWVEGDASFGETDVDVSDDGSLTLLLRLTGAMSLRAGGRLTFGAADRNVMSQSGGALLGLIKRVNRSPGSTIAAADLRPTVLEQLRLESYRLDAPRRTLTLSNAPLISPGIDALPLVDPRAFGDGVEHACCRVAEDSLVLDGRTYRTQRPLLCVFDSGLTGCVLSASLVHELGLSSQVPAKAPRSLADVGGEGRLHSLRLAVRTELGQRVELGSGQGESPLFYAQSIALDWFADAVNGPHVVALGQCVLSSGVLTVDGTRGRALWMAG